MNKTLLYLGLIFLTLSIIACESTSNLLDNLTKIDEGTYLIRSEDGKQLKITAYGENIIRLQSIRKGEEFFADDHYEMVESHDWPRELEVSHQGDNLIFTTTSSVSLVINRYSLAANFRYDETPVLTEKSGVQWQGTSITTEFEYDGEHFTGLGHGYYGREDSIDLKGKVIHRNYGKEQIEQAPLIVPFYMSSKGYGVFLNSTYTNTFHMGVSNKYSISIDDAGFGGRMDYFFIAGPELKKVLDRYTQLTGRPRLPPKSIFGLQLSDKGHDHNSSTPSNEQWWKAKINAHRSAGFPLDHIVNDNRWRAAGGKRCESKIEWDTERYPDPAKYKTWLHDNGLTTTLDFNRCIAKYSEGWQEGFNLPKTRKIDFPDSAPDLTNDDFRQWFWQVFYDKALDPKLNYPGVGLWIDEFDEQGAAPKEMLLSNQRSSAEMRNYWFFLIAKALVEQGWDKSDINKRPFVWVRGMTAGAQRYATLWSGDIYPNYDDMQKQIRAMQLAGLSGFPFWGHDAGGFFDWEKNQGPDDELYIQWAMAMGSFAPIWKPHGMGESRWPLDNHPEVQKFARHYMEMRYELMPYLYWNAHIAAKEGIPIARAMLLEYQDEEKAWKYDQQYMWGDSLLIAPNATGKNTVDVWLPQGNWYDYETKQLIKGGQVLAVEAPLGKLPMFVKEGAVIPRREFALSTAFIDKEKLIFDIYAGGNYAHADVIEDDEISDAYRQGKYSTTRASYNAKQQFISIESTLSQEEYLPPKREYEINIYGTRDFNCIDVDGERVIAEKNGPATTLRLAALPATKQVQIKACASNEVTY